ncbi:MAG: 1-acyl-sn-glycerol-3-phosphate acyltransferase, partial [Pseudomonadota bacterium]
MSLLAWLGLAAFVAVVSVWFAARGLRACRAAARANWGRGWLNTLDGLNRIFCQRFHRLHA